MAPDVIHGRDEFRCAQDGVRPSANDHIKRVCWVALGAELVGAGHGSKHPNVHFEAHVGLALDEIEVSVRTESSQLKRQLRTDRRRTEGE